MIRPSDTTPSKAASATSAPGVAWPQIENPVTGERMVFLRTTGATGGAALEVQFDLPPAPGRSGKPVGSPRHYHRTLEETFEVSSGVLEMVVGDRTRVVGAGEVVVVPPRTPHAFRNASSDWVTFTTTLSPPAQFERFLRAWYGLAQAGLVDGAGMPRSPLFLALAIDYADLGFPGVPDVVQRVLVRTVSSVARLVGAERRLDEHLADD